MGRKIKPPPGGTLRMLAAALCLALVAAAQPVRAADAWTIPDVKALPDDATGRPIKEGQHLFTETYQAMGPEVADEAKRFAGNNLACSSCHLDEGLRKFGNPIVGVGPGVEDKINNCLVTSMNGRPLAAGSAELTALVAYIKFLDSKIPPDQAAAGHGQAIGAAGNSAEGKKIYTDVCAACHQRNGLGNRNGDIGDRKGYLVPPLWGKDSFGAQAPFTKPGILASFIHNNMPQGTTWEAPVLSPEDAANVAAFVLGAPRPGK